MDTKNFDNELRSGACSMNLKRFSQFKLFFILAILFYFTISCQFQQARENLKNCKFSLEDVGIKKISFSSVDLEILVGIKNPNDSEVVVDRMDMEIFLDGKHIGKGSNNSRVDIPSGSLKTIKLDLQTTLSQIGTTLLSTLKSSDAIPYKLNGTAYLKVPLVGEIPFDFTVEDKIEK